MRAKVAHANVGLPKNKHICFENANKALFHNTLMKTLIISDKTTTSSWFDFEFTTTTQSISYTTTNPDKQSSNVIEQPTDQSDGSYIGSSAGMTSGLIVAAIFGVVCLVTVVTIVGKRFYDSWQKRHYTRMDYLINGMYN
jgi:hypothetical protein